MRKGRKLQRTLLSLIMVMAMVFTMATIPGEVVKAESGYQRVEFCDAVLDETDDMKNTNGRYEVECQSEIQNYYLKVVNDENADYKLAVAGKHYKDRNF